MTIGTWESSDMTLSSDVPDRLAIATSKPGVIQIGGQQSRLVNPQLDAWKR